MGFPKNVLNYLHEFFFAKRYCCKERPKYLYIYEDTYEHCIKLLTRCEKHKDKIPVPRLTAALVKSSIDESWNG
ncbi:MAG: hypothetical protein ABII93_01980 [Chrysiogenia bacterium]